MTVLLMPTVGCHPLSTFGHNKLKVSVCSYDTKSWRPVLYFTMHHTMGKWRYSSTYS